MTIPATVRSFVRASTADVCPGAGGENGLSCWNTEGVLFGPTGLSVGSVGPPNVGNWSRETVWASWPDCQKVNGPFKTWSYGATVACHDPPVPRPVRAFCMAVATVAATPGSSCGSEKAHATVTVGRLLQPTGPSSSELSVPVRVILGDGPIHVD